MIWIWVRIAANGRNEVCCPECGNWFWLTEQQLRDWSVCPHCVGWSTFTGAPSEPAV